MRFLNPKKEIRLSGGREINLKNLQPLALYVADALFIGGYLTTPGQASVEAQEMIKEMGFYVEAVKDEPKAKKVGV